MFKHGAEKSIDAGYMLNARYYEIEGNGTMQFILIYPAKVIWNA